MKLEIGITKGRIDEFVGNRIFFPVVRFLLRFRLFPDNFSIATTVLRFFFLLDLVMSITSGWGLVQIVTDLVALAWPVVAYYWSVRPIRDAWRETVFSGGTWAIDPRLGTALRSACTTRKWILALVVIFLLLLSEPVTLILSIPLMFAMLLPYYAATYIKPGAKRKSKVVAKLRSFARAASEHLRGLGRRPVPVPVPAS